MGVGLENKLDKMPPVLLRAASLTDCVLVSGVGGGDLTVLLRCRVPEGLASLTGASRVCAFGSRVEEFLALISRATCTSGDGSNLVNGGTSTLRTDADPEPECGV